jgi:hypothetical protein
MALKVAGMDIVSRIQLWPDAVLGFLALSILIGGFRLAAIRLLREGGKRGARPAKAVLATDDRPFFLLLRSFADDGAGMDAIPHPTNVQGALYLTNEQQLVASLQNLGPVVAIGRPGEGLPEPGAARLYVETDAETWKTQVQALMARAGVVVIRCGNSPGLMWELQTAVGSVPPERLLLWLIFGGDREADWRAFCARAQPVFASPLPKRIGNSVFLFFRRDWKASLSEPSRSSLDALRPMLQQLNPQARVPPRQPRQVAWLKRLGLAQMAGAWLLGFMIFGAPAVWIATGAVVVAALGGAQGRIAHKEGLWSGVIHGWVLAPSLGLVFALAPPAEYGRYSAFTTVWFGFAGPMNLVLLLCLYFEFGRHQVRVLRELFAAGGKRIR